MSRNLVCLCLTTILLTGCGVATPASTPLTTSVMPSAQGIPNSVATDGKFQFVSVQQTGEIVTYVLAGGVLKLAVAPYTTSCADPSGLAVATIAQTPVLAAICYDAQTLLTFAIRADGSLSPLGSVPLPGVPYPGIAIDGTTLYVPLFHQAATLNGAIAKVDLSLPTRPLVVAVTSMASPVPGGTSNPGYLAAANGFLFVDAGSESQPLNQSSTIQVIDEATMSLVGTPFVVPHSPQQLSVSEGLVYVTLYDAQQLMVVDATNPASLALVQTVNFGVDAPACHPLPVLRNGQSAFIGCYEEATLQEFTVASNATVSIARTIAGIVAPQRIIASGTSLLIPASQSGGSVYFVVPVEH